MTNQDLDEIIRLLKIILQELRKIKANTGNIEINTDDIVELLKR